MFNAEWCDQMVIHSEMDNNIPNGVWILKFMDHVNGWSKLSDKCASWCG